MADTGAYRSETDLVDSTALLQKLGGFGYDQFIYGAGQFITLGNRHKNSSRYNVLFPVKHTGQYLMVHDFTVLAADYGLLEQDNIFIGNCPLEYLFPFACTMNNVACQVMVFMQMPLVGSLGLCPA